jgi:hypothetical protein
MSGFAARLYSDPRPPAVTPGADWTRVFDFDWSTLATQLVGGDGAHTYGAYTFTKFNTANEAAATGITNGQGLIYQPALATDYNAANRTLAGMLLPFTQITFPRALQWSDKLRIWIYVSADNCAANYDSVVWGVDTGDTRWGMLAKRGFNIAGAGLTSFDELNAANTGFNDQATPLAPGNRVCVLEGSPSGQPRSLYAGAWPGGGWPAIETMTLLSSTLSKGGAAESFFPAGYTLANLAFVFGAQKSNSATALSATIQRLAVDWKSGGP